MVRSFYISVVAFTLASCASNTIEISSADKATVSLLEIESNADETVLGETPVKVEIDKIRDKLLKATSKDKIPQYILILASLGKSTKINLRLEDKIPNEDKKNKNDDKNKSKDTEYKVDQINRFLRLLLNSYKNLLSEDYELSLQMANDAKDILPEASAPSIVIGLAYMKLGQKEKAIASFNRAKSLDPQDASIDELVKIANE